tara:strand:- start:1637 stop:1954 length:318 start_codon:yes stop_codon:yes gene_type:complete
MVTEFQNKVYNLLKKIPSGKVTTYKILAEKLNLKAYRAVGNVLRNNPFAPETPCHRVIKSNGEIGGFMGSTDSKEVNKKISLLKKEGIIVKNNLVLDFEKRLHHL